MSRSHTLHSRLYWFGLGASFLLVWASQAAVQPTKKPATPDSSPAKAPRAGDPLSSKDEKGTVDLRPKFKKGDKLIYKMDLESKSKTTMPALDDAAQEQSTKQELGLVFTVKEVTDDASIVELTFSTVKVTQESGVGKDKAKLEFDSSRPKAKDKDNPLAPGCRELAGTTFTITIDNDGQVTNVAGGSGLSSLGAMGIPADGLSNLGGAGLTHPAGSTGPSQGFADAIGSIFSIKKGSLIVKVGEQWSTSDEIDSGLLGRFRMITDSSLKSHSGNLAKVKVTGRIEPATHSPGGASMFRIKESLYMGDYLWDTRDGALKSMDMDQNVVIESGASGGISMTASSKMNVNRVR